MLRKSHAALVGRGPTTAARQTTFTSARILTIMAEASSPVKKIELRLANYTMPAGVASGLQIQCNISYPTDPRINRFLRNLKTRVVASVIFTPLHRPATRLPFVLRKHIRLWRSGSRHRCSANYVHVRWNSDNFDGGSIVACQKNRAASCDFLNACRNCERLSNSRPYFPPG